MLAILPDCENKANAWFKEKLMNCEGVNQVLSRLAKDNALAIENGEAVVEEAPLPLEAGDGVEDVVARPGGARGPSLLASALPEGWKRTECSVGDLPPLKVYFDHFSHQTGVQRGWCTCSEPSHGSCIKYEFVTVARSRLEFCSMLFAWHRAAARFDNKADHLGFAPSAEEIADLERTMLLADF